MYLNNNIDGVQFVKGEGLPADRRPSTNTPVPPTATPTPTHAIFMSALESGTTADGLAFAPEDIIRCLVDVVRRLGLLLLVRRLRR